MAEARLKFCKIPRLLGDRHIPAWSFGRTNSVVWTVLLYLPVDFNDSASLVVLGMIYLLDIRRAEHHE
jgi:hypothetical protein